MQNMILISLAAGLLIATIAGAIWKGQLKSIYAKSQATDYVKRESLSLTKNSDRYLFKNLQVIPKPQQNQQNGGQTGGLPGGIIMPGVNGQMSGVKPQVHTIHLQTGNPQQLAGYQHGGIPGQGVRPPQMMGGRPQQGSRPQMGGRPQQGSRPQMGGRPTGGHRR